MNSEDREEMRGLIRRELDKHFKHGDCPSCGMETKFLVFEVASAETYWEQWRCLNCLGLFVQELRPAEPVREPKGNESPGFKATSGTTSPLSGAGTGHGEAYSGAGDGCD